MKIVNLFILALFLSSMSCNKEDVNPEGSSATLPSCVNTVIEELKNRSNNNPPGAVYQFDFKGQTVFYVPAKHPDDYGTVYDKNCNVICHPDGGITGKGNGKCPDFFDQATNRKVIWEDKR